ncbi:MAG: hypothetical protein DRN14_00090 [Thermoplasmata archaeon]|nr:MAG: hypothetical protein DRN14_00090 [Thermoplasmata archaeon]
MSAWWTGGQRDDVFWRSANSGAMAKTRSKTGKSTFGQYGDIQATDPIGQPLLDYFTIEVKRGYSAYTFMDMMDKKETAAMQQWEQFFHQVDEDRKNAGLDAWMLITRRDRRETLAFFPLRMMSHIDTYSALRQCPHIIARVDLKEGGSLHVYCCLLQDFFDRVSPENFR